MNRLCGVDENCPETPCDAGNYPVTLCDVVVTRLENLDGDGNYDESWIDDESWSDGENFDGAGNYSSNSTDAEIRDDAWNYALNAIDDVNLILIFSPSATSSVIESLDAMLPPPPAVPPLRPEVPPLSVEAAPPLLLSKC